VLCPRPAARFASLPAQANPAPAEQLKVLGNLGGWGGGQEWHLDNNHNITVQLTGQKDWHVIERGDAHPVASAAMAAAPRNHIEQQVGACGAGAGAGAGAVWLCSRPPSIFVGVLGGWRGIPPARLLCDACPGYERRPEETAPADPNTRAHARARTHTVLLSCGGTRNRWHLLVERNHGASITTPPPTVHSVGSPRSLRRGATTSTRAR
jgi:hypothetical protein